jgi:small subunit ribosomal protein S8
MAATDPIADLLTRIRNAQLMGHDSITLPASKLKQRVAEALAAEGYVRDVEFKAEGPQGQITVGLKYGPDKSPVINEIRRVSRPGRRVYVSVLEIPRVKNGLGVAILSTSKGVLVDREARKNRLGGELLCTVW